MLLALRFCQAADNPFFRLAFNSLGAYATIQPPPLPRCGLKAPAQ